MGQRGRPLTSGVATLKLIWQLTNKDYGPYGATVETAIYRLRAQKIDVFYGYNTHAWNLGTGTTTTIEVLELNTKYHEILLRLKSVLVRASNKKTMAVVNIFPQSFLKCAG